MAFRGASLRDEDAAEAARRFGLELSDEAADSGAADPVEAAFRLGGFSARLGDGDSVDRFSETSAEETGSAARFSRKMP